MTVPGANLLVFDSGIGGFGVVAELQRLRPRARLTYLADTGFYPYGDKPDHALIGRIMAVMRRGIELAAPDAVVVACNTASTVALAALREGFALPFIGCVPPIKPAAAASKTRHIGLLATPATLRRPYLAELKRNFAGDCVVHSHGTPLLADLAERRFRGLPVEPARLADAVAPLMALPGAAAIDSIALGCTHYTFLLPDLQALYPGLAWFDPAEPVARQACLVAGRFASPPAPLAGTALFTAPPAEAALLEPRLASLGFQSRVMD